MRPTWDTRRSLHWPVGSRDEAVAVAVRGAGAWGVRPRRRGRGIAAACCVALLSLWPGAAQAGVSPAAKAYAAARQQFLVLEGSSSRQRYRDQWTRVIRAFRTIAATYPHSPEAARASYTVAELLSDLSHVSYRPSDVQAAIAAYRRVASRFGHTSLADDALLNAARLLWTRCHDRSGAVRVLHTLLANYPKGDMVPGAHQLLHQLSASGAAPPPVHPQVAAAHSPRAQVPPGAAAGATMLQPHHSLLAQPHVVIDPGHGGADGGALGPGGLREKDVTLAIAKKVKALLEDAGIAVTLTRTDDRYVSLEDRTALANRLDADAFVSIHANSNRDRRAHGIETYYLDVTSDRYAQRLARVENAASQAKVNDLQLILADLSNKAATRESMALAHDVQNALVASVRKAHIHTRDLGVKGALFYVLLGARMPAILVETSFLSNPHEGRLLGTRRYQTRLARAIAKALEDHLEHPLVVSQP